MKNRSAFKVAIWWIFALSIAGIFLIFTSEKESRISEAENRMLQGFPKLSLKTIANDEFTTQFEGFLSDQFFMRDRVISFTNGMLDVFNVHSKDDEIRLKAEEMEKELEGVGKFEEEEAAAGDSETATEEEEEDEPVQLAAAMPFAPGETPITSTHSYLWYERLDGTYTQNYEYNIKDIRTYADTLRLIQTYLPADGNILFTQVPLANMAERWYTQQDIYCGWGSSVEMMLENCLEGTSRIHVFSTYDILEDHICGDTPMFYVSDHHWTAEGAYLVAAEMLKKLNLPVIPYDEYTYKSIKSDSTVDGVRDTFNVLYPLTPARSYIVTNKNSLQEIDLMNYEATTYRAFMNNTRYPWRKVVTGANSGRNCLVICDSFGNAFAPYLLAYYDEVHMVDFRSGGYSKQQAGGSIGEMMKYHGIDDVYIVTSTANGLRKDNSLVYLRKHLEG